MFNDFTQHLLRAGVLSASSVQRLSEASADTGQSSCTLLVKLGLVSETDLLRHQSEFLRLQIAGRAEISNGFVSEALNPDFLTSVRALPCRDATGALRVALADGFDTFAVDGISYALSEPAIAGLATASDVDKALERACPVIESVREMQAPDGEEARDLTSDAPSIRAVQRLIGAAFDARASDIHFEPGEAGVKVRIRVDGVLCDLETFDKDYADALVSRIKVMARLNIAERRLPQDGRIRVAIKGHDTDFRVATSPTHYGEAVVLRILDRRGLALELGALGFHHDAVAAIRRGLLQPHGIVLVTGPTGSGKTTTLYAALNELNVPSRKILTIEDPIEYTLNGVNQVQVKPQIGLTFAHALRSFLRQDPDVMMVGEIRDRETAEMAVQAALTGHLVLSTVHTNSAAGAVTRLLDIGVEPYLLASTLTTVVGQRLVRKLCVSCRQKTHTNQGDAKTTLLCGAYEPAGCAECGNTGYKGRLSVGEVLEVDDRVRREILAQGSEQAIEHVAVTAGMRTMRNDALAKAASGDTSSFEVMRVLKEG